MAFQVCWLFALLVIGIRDVVSECHVDGQQYTANSRFTLELYTCIRHHCKCFPDWTWSCPASESERICDATSPPRTTTVPSLPVPFGRGYVGPGFTLPPNRGPGNMLPQNVVPGRYMFPGQARSGNAPGFVNPRNMGPGWWAQMGGHFSSSDSGRRNVLYKEVQSRGFYHESGTGEHSGPFVVRQDSGPVVIQNNRDRDGVRNSQSGYPARKEHVLIIPLEPVNKKPSGGNVGYQTGGDRSSGQSPSGQGRRVIQAGGQPPRRPEYRPERRQQPRTERQRPVYTTRTDPRTRSNNQQPGQPRYNPSRPTQERRRDDTEYQRRRPNMPTQRRPGQTDPRLSRPDMSQRNVMPRPGGSPVNRAGEGQVNRDPRVRGRYPTSTSGGSKQESDTRRPQRRPGQTDPRLSRPDTSQRNVMPRPGGSPVNRAGEGQVNRDPRVRGRYPTSTSGGSKQESDTRRQNPANSNENTRKTVPRSCLVDGQNYALNSRFSLARGCTRLVCYCRNDGTSSCPEDEMQDLCPGRDTADENQPRKQGAQDNKGATFCEADGLRYPVHANFTLRRDCNMLLCRCNTDGGYSCLVEPGQCSEEIRDSGRSVERKRPGRLGHRGELIVQARQPNEKPGWT